MESWPHSSANRDFALIYLADLAWQLSLLCTAAGDVGIDWLILLAVFVYFSS